MAVEAKPLRKALGKRIPIVRIGVGPAAASRATARVLEEHSPDYVIVAGIAGGVGRHLSIGDLVIPSEVVDDATGATYRPHPLPGLDPDGSLVTVDRLHDHESLTNRHPGIDAVDMESAATAACCAAAGVPWTAVRGISDLTWREPIDPESIRFLRPDGSIDLGGATRHVLRHPGALGGFVRIGNGTRSAMGAVTALLSDLLSDVQSGAVGTAPEEDTPQR